jgi:glycine/D-amino acid oxidase-like deaminating enzyme
MKKHIYIIGGGLSGCILGYTLSEKYSQSVVLVDDGYQRCASKVAAGIFNPITGKRMVKTWLADAIFPFMIDFYKEVENKLRATFLHFDHVVKPFDTIAEQNEWESKTADSNYINYLSTIATQNDLSDFVDFKLGGFEVKQSGWIDCVSFIETIKGYFLSKNQYLVGTYHFEDQSIETENQFISIPQNAIVINCTGFQAATHPLWSKLPWQLAKGEVLTINSSIDLHAIINKSVFVCPTSSPNEYRVGATYVWNDVSNIPSQAGMDELQSKLNEFAKFDFKILKTEAEVRPTVKNRKPLLGKHPAHPNQYIFNGFGSKTVSMGPFFAEHLVQNMLFDKPLMTEVDVAIHFK